MGSGVNNSEHRVIMIVNPSDRALRCGPPNIFPINFLYFPKVASYMRSKVLSDKSVQSKTPLNAKVRKTTVLRS